VEHRLRVFEYRVLKGIFGPMRDKITGKCRKPHYEGLHDLYSSPNIIWVIDSKRMKLAGQVACMEERRGVYRVLVGKPEVKRPLGGPKHR